MLSEIRAVNRRYTEARKERKDVEKRHRDRKMKEKETREKLIRK